MSIDDVLHLHAFDKHMSLLAWSRLMFTSRKLNSQLPDAIKKSAEDFPYLSSEERDKTWGLIDIHSSDSIPSCPFPRQGNASLELLESKKTTPPSIKDMHHFRLEIDTMSRNLLIPLWHANLPVVVAGGAVELALTGAKLDTCIRKSCLLGSNFDFDIFIVGSEDPHETLDAIIEAWQDSKLCSIEYFHHKPNKDRSVHLAKVRLRVNDHDVSDVKFYSFDVILEPFKSILDLLTQFDLDCAKFAYDGKNVYTTLSGWSAFNTRTNHLNGTDLLSFRPNNLNRRILKYAFRGYSTVIHDVDHRKHLTKYCIKNIHSIETISLPDLKCLVCIDYLFKKKIDGVEGVVEKCFNRWFREQYMSSNLRDEISNSIRLKLWDDWYCRDIENHPDAEDALVTAVRHLAT